MSRIINSETSIRYARLNMIKLLRGRERKIYGTYGTISGCKKCELDQKLSMISSKADGFSS